MRREENKTWTDSDENENKSLNTKSFLGNQW
jgi:hypothetical protein